MRILITNTVPLNGGDEALLRATIAALTDQFSGADIDVLCNNAPLSRQYLPDLDFDSDLECLPYPSALRDRARRKIRQLLQRFVGLSLHSRGAMALANQDEQRILRLYRNANLVISAPGGFLHDFYDIEPRLRGFEIALGFGRPVVVFGQSVGPFWKPGSKRRVRQVFNRLQAILLREERSLKHLAECDVDLSKVHITGDLAFYWRKMATHLFVAKEGPVRKIALTFRRWPLEASPETEILPKAIELCLYLLHSNPTVELLFLSTCQGIPQYVDDSVIARSIVAALPESLRVRCSIDHRRYHPAELIRAYSEADAYVGMRLHGAILAMLGGTPAMAVAYEEKTPGIFDALDLAPFQIDYRENADAWVACAQQFIQRIDQIRDRLPGLLDKAAETVEASKRALAEALEKGVRK